MQVPKLQTVFWSLTIILFTKVFVSILLGYADYFPPNFQTGFLIGREEYFFGVYQFAFYAHVLIGPTALILGTVLLVSGKGWLKSIAVDHRRLGKIQAAIVLGGVVPTGLIMAAPVFIGWQAASGLIAQAFATAVTMWIAIVKAMQLDFQKHEIWATRCYVLLVSPLILRIANGTLVAFDLQTDFILAINAWITWLIPLAIFESCRCYQSTSQSVSATNHQSQFLKGVS